MNKEEFDAFICKLRALCKENGVHLSCSLYDSLQAWTLEQGGDELYFPDIENKTQ